MERKIAQSAHALETKHLSLPLEVKRLEAGGAFEGYASVFNVVDNHNDVIFRGAFERSLCARQLNEIKLLWQHRTDEPIGVIDELCEDARGLFVKGRLLLDVARAKEAHALLKSKAVQGMSIGYTVKEFDIDAKTGVRILLDIDLWEISLVTFPANAQAGVTAIKGGVPKTMREFEHFLRDAGFSRRQAKSLAAHGFGAAPEGNTTPWDAGELDTLLHALDRAATAIQP